MEKHQKAYEIWYDLALSIHSDEAIQKSNNARDFWIKNCIYLTPKCRNSFDKLISLASNYKNQWFQWKEAQGDEKKKRNQELVNSFNFIKSVGRIIQEEVDISYTEPQKIKDLKN